MVYTWGYGVLGCGPDVLASKTPVKIETFDKLEEEITQAHCGTDHAAIVTGEVIEMEQFYHIHHYQHHHHHLSYNCVLHQFNYSFQARIQKF